MEEVSEGSTNAGTADAAARRLEDLEQVTREYAEYSSQSFGLAGLVAGAILALRVLLTLRGLSRWDDIVSIVGGMGWLFALSLARRAYQRRGVVAGAAEAARFRRWYVLPLVYAAIALHISFLIGQDRPLAADGVPYWCAYLAMVAAMPGLFALASRTLRGTWDSLVLVMVLVAPGSDAFSSHPVIPRPAPEAWTDWSIKALMFVTVAIVAVMAGLIQHRAFGRLHRRMALLREHAP